MNNTPPATFPVYLTNEVHRLAQDFYQYHAHPQKAKQVYLNTLSVYAVQVYLTCLGIETDWEQSQSWDPTLQVLADTADLWIKDCGRLECRPVLPGMQECPVPIEVWSDRIGYALVQLDAELTEATLLGFVAAITSETLSIEQLQPMSEFPQFLHQIKWNSESQSSSIPLFDSVHEPEHSNQPITLNRWLQQWMDTGWETLETIRQTLSPQLELAHQFRQSLSAAIAVLENSGDGLKRGKILPGDATGAEPLILLVGIMPMANESEFQITVEVLPISGNQSGDRYLPRSLQLIILDATEQVVLQADGSHSEGLEFQFSGEIGEQFTVQIHGLNRSFEEVFEI